MIEYVGIEAHDISIGSDDRPVIVAGDFAVTDSRIIYPNGVATRQNDCDAQQAMDVLRSTQGSWREHPLLGVGIIEWLHAPIDEQRRTALKNRIRTQVSMGDYFQIISLGITPENHVSIDYERKKE